MTKSAVVVFICGTETALLLLSVILAPFSVANLKTVERKNSLNNLKAPKSAADDEQHQLLWTGACPLTRLVASSVRLSEAAGTIIKDIMDSGDLKQINKDKSGRTEDWQTEADRSAQLCIEQSLRAKFGKNFTIIGEEENLSVTQPTRSTKHNLMDSVQLPIIRDTVTMMEVPSMDVLRIDGKVPNELRSINLKDLVVWIDPLDGTFQFAKALNNPELLRLVTVLIGITHNGRPVAGVVHQPYYDDGDQNTVEKGTRRRRPTGRTVWSIVGIGIFGPLLKPAAGQAKNAVASKRIATTTTNRHVKLVDNALDALISCGLIDGVERIGGAGFKVLRCLEGATAYVFASNGCKKWDTAAPEALLIAAGGTLTDMSGRRIKYEPGVQLENSGGVFATAPGVDHQKFVNAIPKSVKDALPEIIKSDRQKCP